MADKSVKLLFEVARGGAAGDSAATIKSQLGEIMKEINSSQLTAINVKIKTSSLRSIKTQIQNELSNISFTPSAKSIQAMRQEIQSRMKAIPVDFKVGDVTQGTQRNRGGTGNGGSGADPALTAQKKQLTDLINEYKQLQQAAEKGLFGKSVDVAKISEQQRQAKALRDQIDQIMADMQKKGVAAWDAVAKEAETKLAAVDQKIARSTAVAEASWMAKFQQQNQDALARYNQLDANQTTNNKIDDGKQVQALTDAYTRLQAAIEAVRRNHYDASNINEYNQAYREFVGTLDEIEKKGPASAKSIREVVGQIKDIQNSGSSTLNRNQTMRLNDLLGELDAGAGKVSKERLAEISKEIEKIKEASTNAGPPVETFGEKLKKSILMAAGIGSVTMAISKAIQMMRKMVSAVIELDSALTQMQIVTRQSDREMEIFAASMAKNAREIGSSITDLVDSATVYARLGYTDIESANLAKYTSMLSNTGDIEISAAQDAVTAIIKAFDDIDASNIEEVMDKMVEVGNNFPISVSQIAEGMNNAGSTLAASGNSFEQSVALLTAANTTIQNISKSSTGMRTISARIRKTKVELDELGEVVEEAKYQQVIDMLTGKGVQLTKNGEYRATYEIIKDIADVWEELSTMERAGVVEQLAGTRQQDVFYSLINQFREAEGAMDSMTNSAGSLRAAYDIYLDSIQAHIGKFKAAFQELSKAFIESDFVKDFVDLGTKGLDALRPILSTISQFVKALGGVKAILVDIAAVIAVRNISRTAAYLAEGNLLIGEAAKNLKGFPRIINAIGVGITGIVNKVKTMGTGAMIWNGVLAAVAVAVALIAHHIQKVRQEAEELRRATDEAAEAATERTKNLDELIGRYSALAQKENKEKADLDEIASIQQEIVELTGDHGNKVDLVNGSYKEQLAILREIGKKEAENARSALNNKFEQASQDAENAYTGKVFGEGGQNQMTRIASRFDRLFTGIGKSRDFFGGETTFEYFDSATHSAKELLKYWEEIDQYLQNNSEWEDYANNNVPGWTSLDFKQMATTQVEYYRGMIQEVEDAAKNLLDNEALKLKYELELDEPATVEAYGAAIDEIGDKLRSNKQINNAFLDGYINTTDLYDAARGMLSELFPEMDKLYEESVQKALYGSIKEQFTSISDLFKDRSIPAGISAIEEKVNDLNDAWEKWNSGELDNDGLKSLLDKYPELGDFEDYFVNGTAELGDRIRQSMSEAPDALVESLLELKESGGIAEELIPEFDALVASIQRLGKVSVADTTKRLSGLVATVQSTSSAITSATGSATGITSDQLSGLIKLNDDFADAIEFNGMAMSLNAEKAGKILTDMAEDYIVEIDKEIAANMESIQALELKERQLGSLTNAEYKELDALRQSVQQYRVMRGEILETISSYQKWINAQGTSNEDAMFNEVEKAYQHLQNVFQNSDSDIFGQWNTDDTLAALELWAGQIDDFMTNGVLDFGRVQKFIDEVGVYMKDGMQGMSTFIDDLVQKGFGSIQDGQFKLYDGVLLRDISDAFGIGTDTLMSFFKRLNTYGFNFHFDDEEFERLKNDADSAAEAVRAIYEDQGEALDAASNQEVFDKAIKDGNSSLQRRIELSRQLTDAQTWMDEYGGSMDPEVVQNQTALIEQLRSELDALPPVKQVEIDLLTAAYSGKIAELQAEKELQLQVNADFDTTAIDSEIAEYETRIGELQAVVDVANVEETNSKLEAVRSVAEQIAMILDEDYNLTIRTSSAYANLRNVSTVLSTIIGQIQTINRTSINIAGSSSVSSSVAAATSSVSNVFNKLFGKGKASGSGVAMAKGSYDAGGGDTLVGELGRELYVDPATNTWQTVGDNGAEFVKLPKHAIVFNHKQTESLLGAGRINGRGTAMVSGNAKVGGGGNIDLFRKFAAAAAASAYANSGSGSGSGSGSDSSSSGSEKSAFEKLYDYHKHLIAMDQESMEDFLNWLSGAYQQAYNAGEIELDDFYRYQEEVYDGLKDLFDDYMNDMEDKIDNLSHYDNNAKEIEKIYKELLANIEKELQKAYNAGMKDTDDYVQQLKQSFWTYYDDLQKLRDDTNDGAKDAVEELIDYRIDMIKTELNEEKDALKERLNYLKDFYDQQKKMLQDSVEEEDYLKEQAEKRKAVTDLELQLNQLEVDNSAWAQKRKLELAEELAKAREDLRIFERDHAVKMAEEEFDRIYDAQEKEIDKETDLIDDQLKDKKGLYDNSLEDIRNNSMELYEAMMRYNEQYVDGTPDAVTELWEEAYKALQDYKTLYDEWYKEIELVNATGYVPKTTENTGPQVTQPSTPVSSGYSYSTTTTYSPPVATQQESKPAAPSLSTGSYVEVKPGTKWYADSGGGGAWGWARAGTIKYVNERGSHAYNIDGLGWIRKQDIVGYAKGTKNATPGLHRVDEEGFEQVFVSPDGSRYKLFSGGEKVLNAKATNFLYDFASSGGAMLRDAVKTAIERVAGMRNNADIPGNIHMGDVIIQGNANERTVSEIRRAQRENIDYVLKEFRKLNKA